MDRDEFLLVVSLGFIVAGVAVLFGAGWSLIAIGAVGVVLAVPLLRRPETSTAPSREAFAPLIETTEE